jgi:hypothetical protein
MNPELQNPLWWRNRLIYRVIAPILFSRNDGRFVLEEEWRNLIILDACRYDFFKAVVEKAKVRGNLSCFVSRGTDTAQFLRENFKVKNEEIVYVTGNPVVSKELKDKFYKLIPVWRDQWDEEAGTVRPEAVYNAAIKAIEDYPNKRLVIHFMQPHFPYLGYEFMDKMDEASPANIRRQVLGEKTYKKSEYKDSKLALYASYRYAKIGKTIMVEGYQKNLEAVLPYALRLATILPNKTVITADHGEAFGEKMSLLVPVSLYGHFPGFRIRALKNVPWFSVEPQTMNTEHMSAIQPMQIGPVFQSDEEQMIEERLKQLGYE